MVHNRKSGGVAAGGGRPTPDELHSLGYPRVGRTGAPTPGRTTLLGYLAIGRTGASFLPGGGEGVLLHLVRHLTRRPPRIFAARAITQPADDSAVCSSSRSIALRNSTRVALPRRRRVNGFHRGRAMDACGAGVVHTTRSPGETRRHGCPGRSCAARPALGHHDRRSTRFSSSRTFPVHRYSRRRSRASFEKATLFPCSRLNRSRKCSVSGRISSFRSRKGAGRRDHIEPVVEVLPERAPATIFSSRRSSPR